MAKTATATTANAHAYEAAQLDIVDIDRSLNYRKTYVQAELEALASSIAAQGVIQPIVVRPAPQLAGGVDDKYLPWQLVAGERRIRASLIAGRTTIPVVIRRDLDDASARAVSLIENLQRKDVDPLEEADGFRELHEVQGWPVSKIADSVGQKQSYIYARIRLCALTDAGRKLYAAGQLDVSTAVLVARIPTVKLQDEAVAQLRSYGRHIRYEDAQRLIFERYMLRLAGAPFDTNDADLGAEFGATSCTNCPKRTGNQRELFADVKATDTCTDPACYRLKSDEAWKGIAAKAEEKGQRVVADKEAAKLFPHGEVLSGGVPFVDLADECWEDPKRRKYKNLIAKGTTVHVARDPSGKVHQLVARADLAAAIKGAGIKLDRSTVNTMGRDSADDRIKQRRRRAITMAAIGAVVEAATGGEPFWRLLLEFMLRGGYSDAVRDTVKRRGLEVPKGGRPDDVLERHCSTLTGDELPRLVLELFITNNAYFSYSEKMSESITSAAKCFGVDVKAIEKRVGSEFDIGQKAKKAAKKGGRK